MVAPVPSTNCCAWIINRAGKHVARVAMSMVSLLSTENFFTENGRSHRASDV